MVTGGGLPPYSEQAQSRRQSDKTLTVMMLIFGGIAAVMIGASFYRESMALKSVRRHRPWDV